MSKKSDGALTDTDGSRAISPVLGAVFMAAIVIVLIVGTGAFLFGFTDRLAEPAPVFAEEQSVQLEISNGTVANQTLVLRHGGGDSVSVGNLHVRLTSDSEQFTRTVPQTGDLTDGTWSAGETVPLSLNTSRICGKTDSIDMEVVYQGDDRTYTVSQEQVPVTEGGFTIQDGQVVPVSNYTATATVVGTGLTYGSPGPNIPIFLDFDIGGSTYEPWPGNVNNPNNPRSHTFTDQPAGAAISVAATRAAYGYLDSKTRWSNASTTWVRVLRDGDTPPNIQGFGGQASIASYVGPYVDSEGKIDLADNQAIYLFELGTSSSGPAADYQDVVVLVSLQTQAQSIGTYTTAGGNTAIICSS